MNKNFEKMIVFSSSFFMVQIAKLLKLSFFIGSKIAQFSAINILGPVFGAFFGISNFLGLIAFSLILKFLGFNALSVGFVTFGLPTLFASLTLKSLLNKNRSNLGSFALSTLLPIICMGLFFMARSSIGLAKLYAAYWLIPVFAYFALNFVKLNDSSTLFLASLSSTFIAHAIGSVIWAFRVPMTAEQWISLIPLVALERIVFAAGISVSYLGLVALSKYVSKKASKYQNFFSTNF